ncbi:MAG TPA: HAMP domain-containing protein, partial [Kofleriaceae bacterium]
MRRLRWKILLAMVSLVIITLGASAVISRHVTKIQIGEGRLPALPELERIDQRLIELFAIAGVVAIGLTIVISRRITRPIEDLTTAVRDLAAGKSPAPVPVVGNDELARLAEAFNAMTAAVARQEDLRRRMAGDVAHELRTPLTNLRCELEAIQDGLAVADAPRVTSLHEATLHLQRLVEDLQDLALAEAGVLRLHREPVALAKLGIESTLVVDADPTRLRQIIDNLTANAKAHATEVRIT